MPPFTDFDASCPVPLVGFTFWIVAALQHCRPNVVKMVQPSFFGVTMPVVRGYASAGHLMTTPKSMTIGNMVASAITSTAPQHIACGISASSGHNGNQSTKALSGDIFDFAHDGLQERLLREVARPAFQAPPRCAF